MSEGQPGSYQQLQEKKNLREILGMAMEFERTARDFYRKLTPKVSKRIRYLVAELAEEEQHHFDLFTNLVGSVREAELDRFIPLPASDSLFSDAIQIPKLGDNPDDQSILQFALGREQTAMEQYSSLAEQCPHGAIKDLFLYLANEETKHKLALEKLYYQLVHATNV